MKRISFFLILSVLPYVSFTATSPCTQGPLWIKKTCLRLHEIWYEGKTDLIITGYAWHNRYTYRPEKIKTYNELAWGGGLSKEFYDEDGDSHALYAIAFSDSHKNLEPALGYAFLKTHHFSQTSSIGLGYTVLVTMRPDINNGIPFPGILPWLGLNYGRAGLIATYIPGAKGAGNVLFLIAKWHID